MPGICETGQMHEITLFVEANGRWRADAVMSPNLEEAMAQTAPRLIDSRRNAHLQLRRGARVLAEYSWQIGWVAVEDDEDQVPASNPQLRPMR
jgi:hypothetical protein